MEKIVSIPGLQHLAEKVFFNLDVEDVKICGQINQNCKQFLENPLFWLTKIGPSKESQKDWLEIIRLVKNSAYEKFIVSYLQLNWKKEIVVVDLPSLWFKKFKTLPMENQNNWIKIIKSEKNFEKEKAIISYLLWQLKKKELMSLPCYTLPDVQDIFRKRIRESCMKRVSSYEETEVFELLAPLTDNANAPDEQTRTPIFLAALYGNTEMVQILAPFVKNPNAPDRHGDTPIYHAAFYGHTEIVRILVRFTDNPNAPNRNGKTPIHWAAFFGHTEIVEILTPFAPNVQKPGRSSKSLLLNR